VIFVKKGTNVPRKKRAKRLIHFNVNNRTKRLYNYFGGGRERG
jgi:hypothetical protein